LRTVLDWLVKRGDPDQAEQFAAALWRFWYLQGSLAEGRAWVDALLRRRGGNGRTVTRARALDGAGVLLAQRGDVVTAQRLHEEALTISRELGDLRQMGVSLNNLGMNALYRGDFESARRLLEEA